MISLETHLWESVARALAPPPVLSVSAFAEQERVLSRETSRLWGRWRNHVVPYGVGIMDALGPHDPHEIVVLMKSAQTAGTELGLNAILFWILQDPSSILLICPSIPDARKFSRRRIRTMILNTPRLREAMGSETSRSAGSNTLYREYPGGALIIVGANAPAGIAGNPLRRVVFDDADQVPWVIGEEGDPFYVAEMRTTTYPDRKLYINGTPKVESESRVENVFLRSDQRRYFVPCPFCGRPDFLTWSGYRNFKDLEDGRHFRVAWDEGQPETAHLICGNEDCGARIEESHKAAMLAAGEWRATETGDGRTAGFHLSGLYSPFEGSRWGHLAREFLETKGDPVTFRGWMNLRLGETFRRYPTDIRPHALLERFEDYPAEVPNGVAVLEMSVDTQDYGLLYLVNGYGVGEESWAIEYGEIPGDPGQNEVWQAIERLRLRTWKHQSGRTVGIDALTIDSGGHYTSEVYEYVRHKYGQRVYAIRGGNDPTAPLVGKASKKNMGGVRLWTLGVDSGKDTVHGRLKLSSRGPGYMHFPKPDHAGGRWTWATLDFANQMTVEVMKRVRDSRRGWTRRWENPKKLPNHAFDLEVYALAALRMRKPALGDLAERAAALAKPLPEGETGEAAPAAAEREQRQSNPWIPRQRGWIRRR